MAVKAGVHNISSGTSGLIKTTDNVNKGTVLGGGNISGSLFQSKSNIDVTKGNADDYGSKIVALTGTAARPGVQQALGAGGALAYTPKGDNRSSTDTGFLIAGGSPTLLSGKSGTGDLLAIPAAHYAVRNSIHSKQNTRRYGDLSDMIFDVFGGGLLAADGAAKTTITNRGSESIFHNPDWMGGNSADSAANPTRSIPGEFFILSTFTGWSRNTAENEDASGGGTGSGPYMDYSAITGG